MKSEFIPFKVHPRIFEELGNRLVTDDYIAIAELVKNSYDAGAKEVDIEIDNSNKKIEKIHVRDDGRGMSLDILKNVWTVLFTPYKENFSGKGRVPSGDKGIGRLAANRIGSKLQIITQEKDSDCYSLEVDWDELISKKSIAESGVTIQKLPSKKRFKGQQGTIITISNLRRNNWNTEENVENLVRELSRIVSIFDNVQTFKIFLKTPSDKRASVKSILPKFLENPPYLLKGSVSSTGKLIATYNHRVAGKNTRNKEIKTDLIKNMNCGPFTFEFRVWDLDSLDNIAGEFELLKADIRKWININKGIAIYRDQILVLPKSQKRHDWLGLDQRRISRVGHRLATNQIIGSVSITKKSNPKIKDTSDRERLDDNKESEQLSLAILDIVNILETQRSLDKISKAETKKTISNFIDAPNVRKQLSLVQDEVSAMIPEPKAVTKSLRKLEKSLDENQKEVKKQIGQFGRLASIGTIASSIIHEIRGTSLPLQEFIKFSKGIADECEHPKKKFGLKYLEASEVALSGLAQLTNSFLPLSSFSDDRKAKKSVGLNSIIQNVLVIHKDDIEKLNIQTNHASKDYELSVTPGELYIVLFNLISNSIYWIGTEKNKNPEISIKCKTSGDFLSVNIIDNGPGVPEEAMEHIFMPGFSTRTNGFGFGLTIVTEIVSKYGGEIECKENPTGKGAIFSLTLPLE